MQRIAIYARVSTQDQNLDPQLDALRAYAVRCGSEAVEFLDHAGGTKDLRPGLNALRGALRRREVAAVVVTKLDRLARSVRQLCDMAAELEALGVALVVLDQSIDTTTPTGRLLFHVLGSVAEFERELILERTRAGVAAARRRGTRVGRPPRLDAEGIARAHRMREAGRSVRYVAGVLGASKSAVHRALRAK